MIDHNTGVMTAVNSVSVFLVCSNGLSFSSGHSRGFGFVLYETNEIAEKVIAIPHHVLKGKHIDCKRAAARKHSATDSSTSTAIALAVAQIRA